MSFQLTDLEIGEFHLAGPYGTIVAQATTDHFKIHKYFERQPPLEVLNGTLAVPENMSGLFGDRIVTLVDPYVWESRRQIAPFWKWNWKVSFRYATVGRDKIQKDDAVVESVSFGITDLRYTFDHEDTHGIMSAKDRKTLFRVFDEGFNMDELAAVTMKNEVFNADTAIGSVVGRQGPVTVDAFTFRSEPAVDIKFESPVIVIDAILRALVVSRFFAALVGRSQNIEWMTIRTSAEEKQRKHHNVIVGKNHLETFDTSNYGKINQLDTLIHSVRHREELESILTNWIRLEVNDERRAESRRVMHRNYGNVFSPGRLYDGMRIPEWVIPHQEGGRTPSEKKDAHRIALVRKNCPELDPKNLPKMVRLARRLRNFHSHSADGLDGGMSPEDVRKLEGIHGGVFLTQIVETVNGLADLFECGYDIRMLHPNSRHPFRQCIQNFGRHVAAVSKEDLMNA